MAALCVTEAICESIDNKQTLYTVSLDAQKAFDVVSHDILFQKLAKDDVPRGVVAAIMDLYTDAEEQVYWNGVMSEPYSVQQGVRQGAVLSTELYKLYINSLLDQLDAQQMGIVIGSSQVGSPTCADDVLLMATNLQGCQQMLDEAALYADRHHYSLHPSKSIMAVFNSGCRSSTQPLLLKDQPMKIVTTFSHLGITRDTASTSMSTCIRERTQLGQKTVYSLMHIGLHGGHGLNPAASLKVIDTYVLPRMMYCLEATKLTTKDTEQLEVYHRGLLKDIQSLPKHTASEAVYLLLGTLPTTAVIHTSMMGLAGSIARLSPDHPLHQLAIRQLLIKNDSSKSWFVGLRKVADKYNIPVIQYMNSPWEAQRWKNQVKKAITAQWLDRLTEGKALKSSLKYLKTCTTELQTHPIWKFAGSDPRNLAHAAYRAKMLTGSYILQTSLGRANQHQVDTTCQLCREAEEDMPHFLLHCPSLETTRAPLVAKIDNILSKLNASLPESDAERCVVLLNGVPSSRDTRLAHNPPHVQKPPPSPCRCCGPVIRPDLPAKSGPQVAHGHPRSSHSRSRGSARAVGPDGSLSLSSSLSGSNPSHLDPLVSQLVSARDSSSSAEGCFCKVLESLNKACNLLCYRLHEKRKNNLIDVTKSRTRCGAPNVKGGKS